MAYDMYSCKAYNSANVGDNLIFFNNNRSQIIYLKKGYYQASYSTSDGTVEYRHSCAHNAWHANNRSITISMDNALRNAISSKLSSGGLVSLQNYLANLPEFQGRDMNGNNAMNIFGFICRNHSITGSFDVTNYGYWEGDWPYNFPVTLWYSYNIPGVGTASDSIMIISQGWYSRGDSRTIAYYNSHLFDQQSEATLLSPGSWHNYSYNYGNVTGPFPAPTDGSLLNDNAGFAYYTIHGVYSRNTGSRGCYNDNAADIILNSGNGYFGGLNKNVLVNTVGAPNKRYYAGNDSSITNNIIMAITNIDFVANTITVKFAMNHDKTHSMVAFQTGKRRSYVGMRINYSFPVTSVRQVTDSWSLTFVNKGDFNPTNANGNGASTIVWDSANRAVVLTAGNHCNNSNGFSKIISRSSGVLNCSCTNVSGTVRVTIGGYSLTIPSGISTFDIRILATNNSNLGYWRIGSPTSGFAHSFTINYPATENAPIVSFNNELYTAITQAINDPGVPYIFEMRIINNEYSISITGLARADLDTSNNKRKYAISIYDINGDFSSLLVKNGMYVTVPITITADIQIINNTILIKAGYASIGFTSTSIGDVVVNADVVATLLPAVASISKNGSRIGYATTTVNQNSFAFSFSAQKNEVEQTDDFVSHYLQ